MAEEFKHNVVPSLLLMFALACLVPFSNGKNLGNFTSSLETGNGRQGKQLIFPIILGLAPEQNPHHQPYIRNYLPAEKSASQLGPFFGYFPNLFPAPPTTTTTTTTTAKPAPPAAQLTCTFVQNDSDESCKPCPDGTNGGVIQSPNYPDDFGVTDHTFLKCLYLFSTDKGSKVKAVLSPGAAFDYSKTGSDLEFLEFGTEAGTTSIAEGQNFPTAGKLTYISDNETPFFAFYFDSKDCSKPPCKWEMTFSTTV